MRPKVQQRPWQRRAFQYGSYAFWPLLLLWLISSYPRGGGSALSQRQPGGELSGGSGGGGQHPSVTPHGNSGGSSGDGKEGLQHPDELSNTDPRDWLPPKGTTADGSGGSTQQQQQQQMESVVTIGGGGSNPTASTGAGSGSAAGGSTQQQQDQQEAEARRYSSATIYAVRNGNGNFAKFYYRFANVRLTKKALYFYMPPGMAKPDEHWVDFISGNATSPTLPTMIVIKGEVQRQKWFYLPVKYVSTPTKCDAAPWTNKPTFFMQVRYSYNIWHTWNEGLMGAFQTLREQGLLPLAQIDAEGNMREVTEGLSPRCPTIFDTALNATREEEGCVQRLDVVRETKCDVKNQPWCRPGVVSYRRFAGGPIILPFTAASVMNRWAQVYDSMTTDVRDFSLVDGHCFRSLIVGKSNTLNYYQAANSSAPIQEHVRERIDAMAVFKEFVGTAQREFVAAERQKNPAAVEFRGYVNPKMERLRQGLGPEDLHLVEYIAPSEVPGLLREELPQLKEMWAKRRKEIAKIEAAWKSGKQVVSLPDEAGDDEDGDAGSGKDGGGGGKKGGEAQKRRSLRQPEGDGGSSGASGSSSSSSGGSMDGSLVAPGRGEGSRRRLPKRTSQRGLLQAAGGGGAAADGGGSSGGGDVYEDQETPIEDGLLGDDPEDNADEDEFSSIGSDSQQGQEGQHAAEREGEEDEASEVARQLSERETALKAMPKIIKHSSDFKLESPRPVVTYMSRNFFSRGVLNEHDILRYILAKYNVTLRVTTFEEPLLEAMELLQHTDVLLGMHGAGWTNGMFVKHSAVAMQMYPYGWKLPDNTTIRGYNYREIVLASECRYVEWISQRWDYAFFRRIDFNRRVKMEYVLHPDPNGPHPVDGWPGNPWIYQNTYVDMAQFGPYVDTAMAAAGIKPMANPIPVTLNRR